jgi:2-polyprenyl-3-methyl-5-hydroxy-6-metoxy-1,4-benzoquinol methylase
MTARMHAVSRASPDSAVASMTVEQAVLRLRADPSQAALVRDAYLGADVREAAERFLASGEFSAVRALLGGRLRGLRVLDLGAGAGIASYAFARSGARVVALEPDPSDVVGRGATRRACLGLPVQIVAGFGEDLPFAGRAFDVVYARQVLHHTRDLRRTVAECARLLKADGILVASREHVVDDERQLAEFRRSHPIHQLAGGENAFPLDAYLDALRGARLRELRAFGPWDTVINAFPAVTDDAGLRGLPRSLLEGRFGILGRVAAMAPGITALVRWRLERQRSPGRLYTFVARRG